MATRTFRNFIAKAVYGKEITAMREEHNKLVDEVEELKTKFAAHVHSGITAGSANSGVPTVTTFTSTDAKKIS